MGLGRPRTAFACGLCDRVPGAKLLRSKRRSIMNPEWLFAAAALITALAALLTACRRR